MPEWVLWRNLSNPSSSCQTISLLQIPTGWEHFAHQGFVLGIDKHSLIEMAHMLHRVCSPIVNGECWLMETPRRSYLFNPTCEWRLGNLVQIFAHRIITQSFVNGTFATVFTMMFFFIWEGFARESPWSASITAILLIVGGALDRVGVHFRCAWRNFFLSWLISLCMTLLCCFWETWLPTWEWLLLVCVMHVLSSWSLLHSRLTKGFSRWDAVDFA